MADPPDENGPVHNNSATGNPALANSSRLVAMRWRNAIGGIGFRFGVGFRWKEGERATAFASLSPWREPVSRSWAWGGTVPAAIDLAGMRHAIAFPSARLRQASWMIPRNTIMPDILQTHDMRKSVPGKLESHGSAAEVLRPECVPRCACGMMMNGWKKANQQQKRHGGAGLGGKDRERPIRGEPWTCM